MPNSAGTVLIGWREWVGLPLLGIDRILAKVDTGARTSALHAFDVVLFEDAGKPRLRFSVRPQRDDDCLVVRCEAPLLERRTVRTSGGYEEERYVIETALRIGRDLWPVEIALTNRDRMGYRMLVGRTAIRGRYAVAPGRSCLAERTRRARQKQKQRT